jgi:enamine deaminase RidA (YjgF/YER057c/UK114 family)
MSTRRHVRVCAHGNPLRDSPDDEHQALGKGSRPSQAVVNGSVIYLAGQVTQELVNSVEERTKQVLANVDKYLAECGSDKSKILSATIWLAGIRGFDAMNKAWNHWLDKNNAPARATVEGRLADPRCLVEIMVIAAR